MALYSSPIYRPIKSSSWTDDHELKNKQVSLCQQKQLIKIFPSQLAKPNRSRRADGRSAFDQIWLDEIAPDIDNVEQRILTEVKEIIEWTKNQKSVSFFEFEQALRQYIFLLARLFISLFLCMREADLKEQNPGSVPGYKWQKPTSRLLGTFFGKVRYWRF